MSREDIEREEKTRRYIKEIVDRQREREKLERDKEETRRVVKAVTTSALPTTTEIPARNAAPVVPRAPATLWGMAKNGAFGFLVIFGLVVFANQEAWTLEQIISTGLVVVLVGAVCGVVLFVAFELLKMALAILGIGILLHLLGFIDLFQVLGQALGVLRQ